jgi:hypothetical protein
MAEGDCIVLNNFKEQLMLKTIDLVNDELKIALYSVALNSADGSAPAYSVTNEIGPSGYAAGGKVLAGKVVAQDDANDRASLDATSPVWTYLGAATIAEARLYDNTTGTKWILMLWALSTNSNGADYTLDFDADGVLLLA